MFYYRFNDINYCNSFNKTLFSQYANLIKTLD